MRRGRPSEEMRQEMRCSFCRKSQDTVRKLIASPSSDLPPAYICDECIAVCNSILEDDARHTTRAEPPLATLDLNQITAPSTDVARSIEFYQRLGLRLIVDGRPNYARFECPAGDATFSVDKVDQVATGDAVIVYFECENLDSTYAALKDRGFEFESEPVDQPWLWQEARLRDPDGNSICLFHAGANRKNPPWRVHN